MIPRRQAGYGGRSLIIQGGVMVFRKRQRERFLGRCGGIGGVMSLLNNNEDNCKENLMSNLHDDAQRQNFRKYLSMLEEMTWGSG